MCRNDIHSPKNFDPAAYSYVGSIYQGASEEMDLVVNSDEEARNAWDALNEHGWADGNYAAKSTCDHCGAAFSYGAVYRHTSGDVICVGHTCSAEAFGHDDRRSYELSRLKARAAAFRKSQKAKGAAEKFLTEHPGLREALDCDHHISADLLRQLLRKGTLSEKQVALALRLPEQQKQREAAQAARDEKLATATKWEEGRQEITGKVISRREEEAYGGGSCWKMLVELEDGRRCWGTIPANLTTTQETDADGFVHYFAFDVTGSKISFNGTIQLSKKDPYFAFFKRPASAVVLEEEVA